MRLRPYWLTPLELVNLNAETAKNDSFAKLVGMGLGACTNARAAGCVPRNCSMALGCGPAGSVAMSALRKSRKPSAVGEGKVSTEGATVAIWTCASRWKRTGKPGRLP